MPTPWAAAVADGVGTGGLPLITSYATGRHRLDVCVDHLYQGDTGSP